MMMRADRTHRKIGSITFSFSIYRES